MIIFLCSPEDMSARGFVAALNRQHVLDARIVTPQELVYAPDMEHRLANGKALSRITLKEHGVLDSRSMTGVVNRLEQLPDEHLKVVAAPDRGYIRQELLAIWSSWISALPCPVINRPNAVSISGPMFHKAVWLNLASQAGLPTPRVIFDVDTIEPTATDASMTAIVCRDQCHSMNLPRQLFAACIDLAAYAGFDMLELGFGHGPNGPVFSYASPLPTLHQAPAGLIDQLAQMFQGARQ